MPGAAGYSQSQGRVKIKDSFLEAHKNEFGNEIDLLMLTPVAAFENTQVPKIGPNGSFIPRGISIDGKDDGAGGADWTATVANINGKEMNDPDQIQEMFATHITHGNRFRCIYPRHTTARGIIIHQ